jgi:hypothetical protein
MIPDTGECNEHPIGICSQCQDWAGFVYVDEEGEELPYGTMPVECAAAVARARRELNSPKTEVLI